MALLITLISTCSISTSSSGTEGSSGAKIECLLFDAAKNPSVAKAQHLQYPLSRTIVYLIAACRSQSEPCLVNCRLSLFIRVDPSRMVSSSSRRSSGLKTVFTFQKSCYGANDRCQRRSQFMGKGVQQRGPQLLRFGRQLRHFGFIGEFNARYRNGRKIRERFDDPNKLRHIRQISIANINSKHTMDLTDP